MSTQPDAEVLAAITVVKRHLDDAWISDGCREAPTFGCVSCRALALRHELTLLEDYLIEEDAAITGFLATLTDEQKQLARDYRGDDTHGQSEGA
jgi:hypothetical protein